jgi:hypothetical protein
MDATGSGANEVRMHGVQPQAIGKTSATATAPGSLAT